MSKKVLVPIATGTEEMEAVTVIDIMVRAGYDVVVASAESDGELTMKASRGVTLTADCRLVDIADDEFDAIILPGGVGGSETFRDSTVLVEIVRQQMYEGKLVAAICAAPALVLAHHKLYPEALMTCHPNFESHIPAKNWRVKRVTYDVNHNLLTSQGPGTALEFAIEIIIRLSGKAHAWTVAEPMVTIPTLHYHEIGEA
ncbi:DJ-1 family glyoxalase III [Vibrio panuliri]|uniref:Oxidative-stress-resistance chaperone n=1 Tax=Vibrio panuliri TaxID=1381081 RepID=A0A1Q9HLL5_9VIBR|nr:DJ-1 family glyoxalase III [Vibrio panuliri]KAB1453580.1 DJ-1 family protein [Vibrio panuliri]OLQ85163.1 oxidative-stress-resistance chaperone [Vibrio panuliri]OLQ91510.1 oxidative-stress-resistance chaperone [Vibrio panuliri]